MYLLMSNFFDLSSTTNSLVLIVPVIQNSSLIPLMLLPVSSYWEPPSSVSVMGITEAEIILNGEDF